MSSNVELVAFDLGNVLCTVDEMTAAQTLSSITDISPDEVHDIVFGQQHKMRFERGEITFDEHAVQALSSLGIDMPLEDFTGLYDSVLIPSESMFPLVGRITETHRIALVSNTSEPHWKSAEKFLPFSSVLDPVIVSYEVDSMKPEPLFYEALLDQSGINPGRILFIDDLPQNIRGAREAGMIGHQFTTQSDLELALNELGVLS